MYLTKRMEIVTWIVSIPDPRSASLRLRPREALPEANMRGLWPRNWPRSRPSETFCADKSKHSKATSRRAPTSPRSRTARGPKRCRRTASRNQLKTSHTTTGLVTKSILLCWLFKTKSRIDVKKCVFDKRTINVCVSCCWRCPGTYAPSAGFFF